MASITSSGLGSGLNIESLISSLMAAEQKPVTLLQTKESKETTKLSSWGQIKSALSSLQVAAQALDTRSEFVSYSSSIADSTVASASVSSSAIAGSYSIEVSQLAASQKIKSAGYTSTSTAITSDTLPKTLTLEIGSTAAGVFTADSNKTKTITIDSSNNTLTGLRDAINASKSGVSASLINDGGSSPYRLVLTSDNTGTANTFKLSGLSDFSYNPATATGSGLSTVSNAADAKLTVDGIAITKSSNVVTDAIQGVTLNLSKTNVGSATKLTVTTDTSAIQTKVAAFVSAYNAVASVIKVQTSYNADTKVAGTLNGDASVRSIQSQLKSTLTSMVGNGSTNRLAQIGIAFQKDGSLALDSTKFQAALADTTKDVAGLFAKDTITGVTGIASQIATKVASMLGTDGVVTTRTAGINSTIKNIDKRIDTLNDRLVSIEKRYRAQFTALDSTVSSMNSTSSFLTQQLSALSSLSNYSSSN
ncbi:flagellar filament capping protein FliD [Uliginosibacterium sp. 31-16]|uniref:flagellar filament capping protein FliD n=1 Tax=Uliginosibacterium sp. 31-16 TaxID=3068315 RepID=UPI00273D415F|nr:flagellar filament capping protein FliD [Uliginosibacterium sp. 31-16]MDP5240684.1 flagellar filament capping protein FliD [Uliginosibacterium sp. 31-16]